MSSKTPQKTNPHPVNSPEWQLWENYRTQEQLCSSFTADIGVFELIKQFLPSPSSERYEKLRAEAFAKRDAYAAVLEKLGAKP